MARQTIHIPGKWHGDNPIALATKVGNLVTTSGVSGQNPDTGETPDSLEEQAEWAFEHVRRIMAGSLTALREHPTHRLELCATSSH